MFVQLKFGGEDGHFVCTTKQGQRLVLGVADGVGGSRSEEDPENLVAGGCVAPMTAISQCQQPTPAPSSLSLPCARTYRRLEFHAPNTAQTPCVHHNMMSLIDVRVGSGTLLLMPFHPPVPPLPTSCLQTGSMR